MFLIDAIKPIKEKKFKHFSKFFMRLFRGGELRADKIKPVLFLYTVGLLAATKTLHKTKEKNLLSLVLL